MALIIITLLSSFLLRLALHFVIQAMIETILNLGAHLMFSEKWIDSLLLALDNFAVAGKNNSEVARYLVAIADLLGCAAGFDDGIRISGPASNKKWTPSLHLLEVFSPTYHR